MPVRKPVEDLKDQRYASKRDDILRRKTKNRVRKHKSVPRVRTIKEQDLDPTELWQEYNAGLDDMNKATEQGNTFVRPAPGNTFLDAKEKFRAMGADVDQ